MELKAGEIMDLKTEQVYIGGMTCINCRDKIEKELKCTQGVQSAEVSYTAGTAKITYDADEISLKDIYAVIEKLDYTVRKNKAPETGINNAIFYLAVILAGYILLAHFGILNFLAPSALADTNMGYGMMFVIGLVTSVHCIAMCGGINLSQCIPRTAQQQGRKTVFAPAVLYNTGRVLSYTAIGFLLGFIGLLLGGGAEAGLPVMVQGIVKMLAGCFMVIMGLNMLNIFPWLRKFSIRMPGAAAKRTAKKTSRKPLFAGLLNGLMPCGPLQAVQLAALASGNPITGALSMLLFGLGTVPLMLGLGTFVSALGRKFTNAVTKVGALLVAALGLAMLSQGGSLSGLLAQRDIVVLVLAFGAGCVVSELLQLKALNRTAQILVSLLAALTVFAARNICMTHSGMNGSSAADVQIVNGEQVVRSTLASGRYPDITVRAGMPVKWIIDAPDGSINGCNNRMFIQEYGIEYSFKAGENVITFNPAEEGQIRYSCWMGMIHGTITVTE